MNDIVAIVEAHGGTVDRSLGDGVLCFFSESKTSEQSHHAVAAFEAACEIQNQITKKSVGSNDSLIMPVRIGLHSAKVLIGNLGKSEHLDFTMIGSGVNFASRLETACSPFKVTLSEDTYLALQSAGFDTSNFNEIGIAIKHRSSLTRAFEFDPCSALTAEMNVAVQKFFDQIGSEKRDPSFDLNDGSWIKLSGDETQFEVLNFSQNGFKAKSNRLFGRKTQLQLTILSSDPTLNEQLASSFISSILVEVRWSTAHDQEFIHGLKIIGASLRKKAHLFTSICRFMSLTPKPLDGPTQVDNAS